MKPKNVKIIQICTGITSVGGIYVFGLGDDGELYSRSKGEWIKESQK